MAPESNPAAQTAFGPMAIAAIEHHEAPGARIVDDDLAASFLPTSYRRFVAATAWAPLRKLIIWLGQRSGRGAWSIFVCRKRYIDDQLASAAGQYDAVVDLGAGLDTRGCRLAKTSPIPVFEVDQPVNVELKRRVIAEALGRAPDSVHLVPVDFARDDLGAALRASGYDPHWRTFFIWEGVTQYIPETAIRSTLDFLGTAAAGSRIVFTYVQRDFIDGKNFYGNKLIYKLYRARRPIWMSGLSQPEIAPLLAEYGWRLLEDVGPAEYERRYLAPAGRPLSTSELERTVFAEKV